MIIITIEKNSVFGIFPRYNCHFKENKRTENMVISYKIQIGCRLNHIHNPSLCCRNTLTNKAVILSVKSFLQIFFFNDIYLFAN